MLEVARRTVSDEVDLFELDAEFPIPPDQEVQAVLDEEGVVLPVITDKVVALLRVDGVFGQAVDCVQSGEGNRVA